MFPEGTRSATGRLRAFNSGAFQIAERNRVPLQPIIVRGTAEALPKRGFVLQGRHPISIEILSNLRLQETGVAAVYGVLLTALSAAAFLLWGREREVR